MELLKFYLSDRQFPVKVDETLSATCRELVGVVLSMILFNIFSHIISTNPEVTTMLYTDDFLRTHHHELRIWHLGRFLCWQTQVTNKKFT